jgi:polyphosphate kinase 2 (PPK2 family)
MHKLTRMSSSHRRARVAETLRFDPQLALENYDAAETCGFADKAEAEAKLASDVASMIELQDMLVAQKHYGILIVLQGMDSAGKDSAIKHVMNGVNPQGVSVHSFQVPTHEELRHDYL